MVEIKENHLGYGIIESSQTQSYQSLRRFSMSSILSDSAYNEQALDTQIKFYRCQAPNLLTQLSHH